MTKPFLILQLRANDLAAQSEFDAFLRYGGIDPANTHRVRMESEPLPEIDPTNYAGIIVGGGPWNVSDANEKKSETQKAAEAWLNNLLQTIIETDTPYLGACYGFGALVDVLGGTVSKERYAEDVEALTIKLTQDAQEDPLLQGIPTEFRAFAGHKESCQEPIEGVTLLASSDTCPFHMIRVKQNVYATQFHPELDVEGICERIDIYKNAGYFPPEKAEPLKAAAQTESVTVPMQIMKRFVELYQNR